MYHSGRDVGNSESDACVAGKEYMENLCIFPTVLCEPKTALKKLNL